MSNDEPSSSSRRLNTKEEMEYEFGRCGERQRLQEVMIKRLKESGWVSKVETLCRESIEKKGVERATVEDLINEVKDPARRMVPDEVKKELMEHIQQFVYDNTSLLSDK